MCSVILSLQFWMAPSVLQSESCSLIFAYKDALPPIDPVRRSNEKPLRAAHAEQLFQLFIPSSDLALHLRQHSLHASLPMLQTFSVSQGTDARSPLEALHQLER